MKMLLTTAIARAVDEQDPALAGMIADHARANGVTYPELFVRVQEVRPLCSLASWDALLEQADDEPALLARAEVRP